MSLHKKYTNVNRLWLEMEQILEYTTVVQRKHDEPNHTVQEHKPSHTDVFHDPVTGYTETWVLDTDGVVTVSNNRNERSYCFMVLRSGTLHVLGRTTCVVDNLVYQHGMYVGDYKSPKQLTKTCFLYDINKYMIQNERDFMILDTESDILDLNDRMVFTNDNGPICFHGNQRIVMYIHRNHVCIAETDMPYQIIMKRIPTQKYNVIQYQNRAICISNNHYNVFLSMFPMSFTDSTKILTTLE